MISGLQESGHKILLVDTVPQWVGGHPWSPDACTAVRVRNSDCLMVADESELWTDQAAGRDLLTKVSTLTGAEVADPWVQVCHDGTCSSSDLGRQIYRDAGHITVEESRRLTAWFSNALAAVTDSADSPQGQK
jgi:hypothetical protein